jgi:hypothetical protein
MTRCSRITVRTWQIATLRVFDHVTQTYVWAHDLVTLYYSDDETDYPALFQLWEPVDSKIWSRVCARRRCRSKPAKKR